MRNLILLLNDMIKLIPNDEELDFKESLEKIRDRASFTAPENQYSSWQDAQLEISKYFENKSNEQEWCTPFINLWTNRQDN